MSILPLIRSIHELTLIFSLDFIIFNASSNNTSPVCPSSMTSITRSAKGNLLLEESFCMLIFPRNANSMTIHPLRAYEMLSFQKDRYPCLSFSPSNRTSSINVSLGCLLLSALSLISLGSYATIWPLSLTSRPVSGVRSNVLSLGAGEDTRAGASSLVSAAIPAPLLLVNPPWDMIEEAGYKPFCCVVCDWKGSSGYEFRIADCIFRLIDVADKEVNVRTTFMNENAVR